MQAPALVATPELQRFEGVQPHMGTLVKITVFAADEASAQRALRAGFDRIAALDAVLSDYRADSELSRVTRAPAGTPVPIGADLHAVLRASQALAAATGGAFDVTQGPVVRVWREARRLRRMPDPVAIEQAAKRSGYRHMHLDDGRGTVMFDIPDMALDVGAIGKGYAASEAIAAITGAGVRSALVAVSGAHAFSEAPPGQAGWRIRIHGGDVGETRVPAVLLLTNGAVSTSGNAEQHLDAGGRRYSHVIDPASGSGLTEDITVTVVANHGVHADGLDTAIGVMGVERGLALVDARPDAAAFVVLRKAGTAVGHASRRMEAMADAAAR